MTHLWTAEEAARATGGRAIGDWAVDGVSIDTRTIAAGDLFVALKDVRDGHDFVAQALANGAGAAMVSRVPDGVADDAPLLIVDEVLPALERLGRAARARTDARVVAVTGSVGKTSTKEMLRLVLGGQGRVHAAEASYNNHWGVPLTLARMPADTEFAVIEIGMSNPGEIAPLAKLARPHVALITTVAAAHLEAFDDLSGIAREKATIFEGLEPNGIAIINADLDVTPILDAAADAVGAKKVHFGMMKGAPYHLDSVDMKADTTIVRAALNGAPFLFKLGTMGRHFAINALAVLAVGDQWDIDPALAAVDLSAWRPVGGRGTRERIILDD
ncbi:MAG: Mur ligase family protein, partial [Pseudomonadota bacterium]|nr:Mur ligase family protein [Pseudomonadota bacterium]